MEKAEHNQFNEFPDFSVRLLTGHHEIFCDIISGGDVNSPSMVPCVMIHMFDPFLHVIQRSGSMLQVVFFLWC